MPEDLTELTQEELDELRDAVAAEERRRRELGRMPRDLHRLMDSYKAQGGDPQDVIAEAESYALIQAGDGDGDNGDGTGE